ncbi:MAG: shikimate dehydrogenase [Eubacterium sp.]|nr:shikimate dehydrogenase [Eubacterium sp.]
MKKFALIGYPLGHSMSPLIHRELFKINDIYAGYELIEINPENFEAQFDALKSFDGFNVTIPHKISVIPHLKDLSEKAALFGAVNTVKNDDGNLTGYNTDCIGFLRALDMADITLSGKVLVCGCGGVSRMFAFEAILAGADLTIAVRDGSLEGGRRLVHEIESKLGKTAELITLDKADGEFDLIINGTPVGMHPDTNNCVLPKEKVQKAKAVFDAVYNPLETKLIRYAREGGIKYSNGLSMLVWQAAAAQEIWYGVKFNNEQIRAVLKITEEELKK